MVDSNSTASSNEIKKRETILDLFSSTVLVKRILIMFSAWYGHLILIDKISNNFLKI